MLTGRLPWDIDYSDCDQMISAHRSLAPIPPTRFAPWLPPQIEALVLRGLAKDPSERPASAQALAQELFDLQFVEEQRASFRRGIVNQTTQPSAAITAWEENERATLDVTDRASGPQSGRGAARQGQAEAGGLPPTRTEGGTSRSLLSVRSLALRARRRNRFLAQAAVVAIAGFGLLEAALLAARSHTPTQAVMEARIPAPAPSLDAGLSAMPTVSAAADRQPSAEATPPEPPAKTTPPPSAIQAPLPSAHHAERPAASGGRGHNTMADDL
jgi:hypothetical protein